MIRMLYMKFLLPATVVKAVATVAFFANLTYTTFFKKRAAFSYALTINIEKSD